MSDAKRAEEAEQYATMLEDQIAEKEEQMHAVMEEGTQALQHVDELQQELERAKIAKKLVEDEAAQYASHLEEELTQAQSQTAELVAEGTQLQKQLEAVQDELAVALLNSGAETEDAQAAEVEAVQRTVQDLRDAHARELQDLRAAHEKTTHEASEYALHLETEMAAATSLTAALQKEFEAIDAERVSAAAGLEAAQARVLELQTSWKRGAEEQQEMVAQIQVASIDRDRFQSELLEVCSCPPRRFHSRQQLTVPCAPRRQRGGSRRRWSSGT
jgi:chromosome segregation ATPase